MPPKKVKFDVPISKLCYKCNENWQHGHVCALPSKTDKHLGYMGLSGDSAVVDFDSSIDEEDLNCFLFSSLKLESKGDSPFLHAPITINGHKVLAALDTMAQVSFIKPALVEKLSLKTSPVTGKVMLGQAGQSALRSLITGNLIIEVSNISVNHQLEVLTLPVNHRLLLVSI
jgi:hypothetical protein